MTLGQGPHTAGHWRWWSLVVLSITFLPLSAGMKHYPGCNHQAPDVADDELEWSWDAPPDELWTPEGDCPTSVAKLGQGFCEHGSELYHNLGYFNWSYPYCSNSLKPYSCASCTCSNGLKTDVHESPIGEVLNNEWFVGDTRDPTVGAECCDGWNGTKCNLCSSLNVCPHKVIDGKGPPTRFTSILTVCHALLAART